MSTPTPDAVRIRPATPADAALLADLAARTFADTFGGENNAADLAMHLEQSYGLEIQRRELADPRFTYLIAEVDGSAAGFALLRAAPSPDCVAGASPIEIHRFYVDAPWHGRGVARALMEACEREAKRRERQTLWLGVWERNSRARRFYEKMGFHDVGSQQFMVGTDAQTDRVMQRVLLLVLCVMIAACSRGDTGVPDSPAAIAGEVSASHLDSTARRIAGFLQGSAPFDSAAYGDSIILYVSPEGGGGSRTVGRETLRDRSRWEVQSGRARYAFAPPAAATKMTTRVGRHFNCLEYPLASRFPELATRPHVAVKLEPPDVSSCLQTWNVTFVFDSAQPPRLIAAVLDRFEW